MERKGFYKMVIVDFGKWVPYIYKRRFLFFWKLVKVGNLQEFAVTEQTIRLQDKYKIPDKRITLKIQKR